MDPGRKNFKFKTLNFKNWKNEAIHIACETTDNEMVTAPSADPLTKERISPSHLSGGELLVADY